MDWNAICTQYFNAGYYTAAQVGIFVAKGKITAAQYQTITGQTYTASTTTTTS